MVADDTTGGDADFEAPRPVKRSLSNSLAETCKKRRKQSTPVRISATEAELLQNGKCDLIYSGNRDYREGSALQSIRKNH